MFRNRHIHTQTTGNFRFIKRRAKNLLALVADNFCGSCLFCNHGKNNADAFQVAARCISKFIAERIGTECRFLRISFAKRSNQHIIRCVNCICQQKRIAGRLCVNNYVIIIFSDLVQKVIKVLCIDTDPQGNLKVR